MPCDKDFYICVLCDFITHINELGESLNKHSAQKTITKNGRIDQKTLT